MFIFSSLKMILMAAGVAFLAISPAKAAEVPSEPAPDKPVPMVRTFTGSPRDIGTAFGQSQRESLREAQAAWLARAAKNNVAPEDLLDLVKPMVAVVREVAPHWIEEAEAVAEAAELDPALYVARMFYIGQASTGFRGWFVPEGEDDCTSYIVTRQFTEGNATLFHRTRDNTPDRQTGAIWDTQLPGIHKFLAVTYTNSREPSVIVNEKGLAGSADAVGPSATKRKDVGMMNGLMLRYIAEKASDCGEALEIIERFVENGWYAGGKPGTRWTIVDRHGTVLDAAHSSDGGSLTHHYRTGKSHVTVTRGGTADKMLEQLNEPVRLTAFRNVSREPDARIHQGRASVAGMTIRIHPEHPEYLTSAWFSFPAVSLAFPMYMGGTETPLPLMDGSVYDLCAAMPADYEGWKAMEEALYQNALRFEAEVEPLLAAGHLEEARQRIDAWTQTVTAAHLECLQKSRLDRD